MEKSFERQLLNGGRAFATFSTIERALASRKKSCRRPYVVQAWCIGLGTWVKLPANQVCWKALDFKTNTWVF